MVNLVTIDAQHQGVFGFPGCLPENNEFCEDLRDLLEIAYTPAVQDNLVQAQYWHDPTQGDTDCSRGDVAPELISQFSSSTGDLSPDLVARGDVKTKSSYELPTEISIHKSNTQSSY